MAFQVTNGSIPETVERFLHDWLGCFVFVAPTGTDERRWCLAYTAEMGHPRLRVINWPHDREPTLQEAIEAVMRGP